MITATEQDYGRVLTAVDIFLTKLRIISQTKGIHVVITSAVREADPDKGRPKRTFDVQPAIERLLLGWFNIYGEMVADEIASKVEGEEPEERRILWTRVTDPSRKNKTRFAALRPGVKNPTYEKIVGLIQKGQA